MAPNGRSSSVLLELSRSFGALEGKVDVLAEQHVENVKGREMIHQALLGLNTSVALLTQQVQQITPIVKEMHDKFNENKGVTHVRGTFLNFLSGAAGGTLLASLISWFSHK